MKQQYLLPPVLANKEGQERKAGFEFEFGNLPVLQTAEALQQSLGGELESKSPFEAVLHGSSLGKLRIERDADILKSVKHRKWLEQLGLEFTPGSIVHEIEANIDNASKQLVPCEVVTEPIPFDQLGQLETLITTLNLLGAEGTQDSLIYAFGLHINPSIPDNDAATLVKYVQAFLLLRSWIIESAEIDITRRYLTKYIAPFPQPYMDLVLSTDYTPDLTAFIDDYLEHNPTRNRALDMLPILCQLDEARVLEGIDEEERKLVKGRPAFHYRLPDCKVNVPGWSAASSWNQWVYVEKVVANGELLQELIQEWRASNEEFSITPRTSWMMRLTSLLSQRYFEK
jgi:hypothetical protein